MADDRLPGFHHLVDELIRDRDAIGHCPPALGFLTRPQDDVARSFLEHVNSRVLRAGEVGGGLHDLPQQQIRLAGLGDGSADVEQRTQLLITAAQLFEVETQLADALPFALLDGGLVEHIHDGLDDIVGFAGLEEEIPDAEVEKFPRELRVDAAGHDDSRRRIPLFPALAHSRHLQPLQLGEVDGHHVGRGRIRAGYLGGKPPWQQDFAHQPLAGFGHIREHEHPRKGLA